MGLSGCPVDPLSCAGSVVSGGADSFFNLFTSWIVASVQWIVHSLGVALAATGGPTQVMAMSQREFDELLPLAPVLLIIGLSVATLQALRHGDAGALWRTYLGVAPACVAGVALARPVGQLVLQGVDETSNAGATGVATHVDAIARFFAFTPGVPGAAVAMIASFVILGTILLWFELILRTIALALLVVVVPVVVPLSVLPSMRRLGWRLGETFAVVAASKFVIVVTLALGVGELTTPSFTSIVTGAVTMFLATLSPFVLFRLIPLMESGAIAGFEGMRSGAARSVRAAGAPSPVGLATQAMAGEVTVPGPPERAEDLGIPLWESEGEVGLPNVDPDAPRPRPPVGQPRPRVGHVVYKRDELGPVVGWHWDE